MSFLVISSSLNRESKSYLLAREAERLLKQRGQKTDFLDLRKVRLPHCDGDTTFNSRSVTRIKARIAKATCILIATPVYNYDTAASAKNLVELTGDAFRGKTVGFLVAAGGQGSRMAHLGLANSIMLDFQALIIPQFVYADKTAFTADGKIASEPVEKRFVELIDAAVRLNGVALAPVK